MSAIVQLSYYFLLSRQLQVFKFFIVKSEAVIELSIQTVHVYHTLGHSSEMFLKAFQNIFDFNTSEIFIHTALD